MLLRLSMPSTLLLGFFLDSRGTWNYARRGSSSSVRPILRYRMAVTGSPTYFTCVFVPLEVTHCIDISYFAVGT